MTTASFDHLLHRRAVLQRRATVVILKGKWRIFFLGVSVTTLASLLLHMNVHHAHLTERRLAPPLAPRPTNLQQQHLVHLPTAIGKAVETASKTAGSGVKPAITSPWENLAREASSAEKSILEFFHDEPRALEDGIFFGGTEKQLTVLTERLVGRIASCRGAENHNETDCTLRVVFVGGGQASGRDIFKNQTYPYPAETRLRALVKAAGLQLEVINHAMDSDLSMEGPQTSHMCVANLVGRQVDVLSWDSESTMQANPSAQIEAFVRWAAALKPALIMFNRGGPHARSRRGFARSIVNLVGNHDAIVYDDFPIPEPRQDLYRNSSKFEELWSGPRNSFWIEIFHKYSDLMDFAAFDPQGSIWHLDHLKEFSNQAFEEGKALPLYDCPAPGHPPPCDQVPPYVIRHLAKENRSVESLPRDDTSGAFCEVLTGCRHAWCKLASATGTGLLPTVNLTPLCRCFHNFTSYGQMGVPDLMH
jgi:hypothetical protein